MELFANQAIPTGGLSGSLMVVRGLTRRGVAPAIAITALLIEAMSFTPPLCWSASSLSSCFGITAI